MKNFQGFKGSITVEAAVILPFFIIAVMSFAFVLKIYYTNELIQNALSGATREMSVYSLLYYKTNAEEIIGGLERFSSSDSVKNKLGNDWLASMAQEAGKDATDYVRAQLALIPVAKLLVNEHLKADLGEDVDLALKNLNIDEGFHSLDFSGCKMLTDGKSVDISVSYEMKFPFLSNLLPGVKINQAASACVWAGEDGVGNMSEDQQVENNVWDMTNIKRGIEIRKLQGANLPFNFPVIAKFQNGKATSIKSLNIDEPYYKDPVSLEKKITGYINKLEEFNGGTCGEVTITSSEISQKELILVIPETELTPNQQSVIDKCILLAGRKGIILKPVKAYGRQGMNNSTSGENEGEKKKSDQQD